MKEENPNEISELKRQIIYLSNLHKEKKYIGNLYKPILFLSLQSKSTIKNVVILLYFIFIFRLY